jgi:hypothetical protein
MGVAQLKQQPRHYQLPAAAMTPLCLPQVGQAIREAHGEIFERECAGIVDLRAHSLLCREALQSGFLDRSAATWLDLYPNQYGLHRLTGELVANIDKAFTFGGTELFPNRLDLLAHLNTSYADPVETARIALAAVENDVVTGQTLAPYLAMGVDGAWQVQQTIGTALTEKMSLPEEVADSFSTGIRDGHFFLESNCLATFTMNIPEPLEYQILLFKTLYAMTLNLLPFHIPATFLGLDSYHNNHYAEAYAEMKDRMQAESREQVRDFLMDESAELPDMVDEYFLCGVRDEDAVEQLLDGLYEMAELVKTVGHSLDTGEPSEIAQLLDEASQLAERDDGHCLPTVLREALALCLERKTTPVLNDFHPSNFPGTTEEGVSVLEGILVDVAWDFPILEESSYESFDSIVNGTGFPSLGLPLMDGQMQAVTLPVLNELEMTLNLLQRIAKATEEWAQC